MLGFFTLDSDMVWWKHIKQKCIFHTAKNSDVLILKLKQDAIQEDILVALRHRGVYFLKNYFLKYFSGKWENEYSL